MAFTAVLSIFVSTLGACGPRLSNRNITVVNQQRVSLEKAGKGLSPKEVESILGQPSRIETFKIPIETQRPMLDGVRYFYEQNGETLALHFVDNKLISELPKLSEPKPAGAAAR